MKRKKGLLQKLSLLLGGVSFLLSLATGVWLYLRVDTVGSNNPISASLLASTFFFAFVGVIFFIIGMANLPNLKIGEIDTTEG